MKLSLSTKITFSTLLIVVVFSLLLVGVFSKKLEEKVATELEDRLESDYQEVSKYFKRKLIEPKRDISYLSSLPSLEKKYKNKDTISFIRKFLNTRESYLDIKLVDIKENKVLAKYDDNFFREFDEYNLETENIEFKGDFGQFNPTFDQNYESQVKIDHSNIQYSKLELYRNNNEVDPRQIPVTYVRKKIDHSSHLIIEISMRLDKVFSKLNTLAEKGSSKFIILGSKGNYLFNSDKRKLSAKELGDKNSFFRENIGVSRFFRNQDSKMIVSKGLLRNDQKRYLFKLDLKEVTFDHFLVFAYEIKKESYLTFYESYKKFGFMIFSLMLVMMTVSSLVVSKFLFKKFYKVINSLKNYNNNQEYLDLSLKGGDEISQLSMLIKDLVRNTNEQASWLKKSEKKQRLSRTYAEETNKSKTALVKKLRFQKKEIEKMIAEKDDLMAIVSHDLKNPLAVIEAAMKILLEDGPVDEKTTKDLLERCQRSVAFALNLIYDLLDIARLEGGMSITYEIFNIQKIINICVDSHMMNIEKGKINVTIKGDQNLKMNADFGRLLQVVSNILGNALKYSPKKGRINIDFKMMTTEIENQEIIYIKISDNGIGIPANKLESIFNKYEQAREKDKEIGTGLGLAICKNIIDLHKGEIWVESKEGKGTTFHIQMPRAMQKEKLIATQNIQKEKSILIVDDTEEILQLVAKRLIDHGMKATTVKSGKSAIKAVKENDFDMVLLDIEMPEMDGLTTLKKIRKFKTSTKLPVVMHSSKITPETIEKFGQLANDYLQKPAKINELLNKVQEVIYQKNITNLGHESPDIEVPMNILLVDDSEDIKSLMELFLKKKGHKMDYASDGLRALEKLKNNDDYDLIFMDMNMPKMNGLETTKHIRKLEKESKKEETPIVMLSGIHDDKFKKQAISAGANEVTDKNLDKNKIYDLLKKAA